LGELAGFPGSTGVIRYVSSGVGYSPPPIPARWRPVPSEPGRHEMPWEGNPDAARGLRALRTDLDRAARAGKLTNPNHPLLRELDEVAAALTSLAEQLHPARWSLGLIQPDNVLIRGREGAREVVPLDLGFAWRGSFGSPPWEDSPGRPDWLDPHTPNRWLWDHEPVRQQFADPDNGAFPPPAPTSDVRTLGRLFAWLISGQTSKDVPNVGGRGGPPPAWSVVADAAAGRIPSAAGLAARLRDAPLSEYFAPLEVVEDRPPSGGGKGLLIVMALLGLLVLAGAGGAALWYFVLREKPAETASNENENPKPPDNTPEKKDKKDADKTNAKANTPDPAAFAVAAKEFDAAAAKGDLSGMVAAFGKMTAVVPPEKKTELDASRAKLVAAWRAAYDETLTIAGDPSRRDEAKKRFTDLEAQLQQLIEAQPAADPAQQAEEKQWLEVVSYWAAQQ
jgi:hypothetical protein